MEIVFTGKGTTLDGRKFSIWVIKSQGDESRQALSVSEEECTLCAEEIGVDNYFLSDPDEAGKLVHFECIEDDGHRWGGTFVMKVPENIPKDFSYREPTDLTPT